jgi:hypothetical protein
VPQLAVFRSDFLARGSLGVRVAAAEFSSVPLTQSSVQISRTSIYSSRSASILVSGSHAQAARVIQFSGRSCSLRLCCPILWKLLQGETGIIFELPD